MNKNSTQARKRNFVSKISSFFKILPVLPAILQRAGGCISVQQSNLTHNRPVSGYIRLSAYFENICISKIQLTYFLNRRQMQLRLLPVNINQF